MSYDREKDFYYIKEVRDLCRKRKGNAMYGEVFEFLIVSKSLWIEQVLRGVEPMEDCTCHFATCSDFGDFYKESVKKNTAVIIDSGIASKQVEDAVTYWAEKKKKGQEVPQTALIFLAGQTEIASECYPKIDHIWMVNAGNDAGAVKEYFGKLVREMKEHADAEKQAICFHTLIDSSKDLIWFKDVDGRHLIVNDEFCRFVNKSKEQIYKQGHCYIWNASKEDEKVCLDSDQEIMLGKRTRKFEEQVHTNEGDYIIQSYKSPLTEDGEVFGTCGIGQNITNERNLEKKLETILNHIPFAVAVVSKEEILTYKNKMFDTYFPQAAACLGKDVSHLKKQLHFPEHLEDGELAEVRLHGPDMEPVWFSYYEKKVLDAFNLQIEKMLVVQDITANKQLEEQKERMAYTDYLTGLSNRRGMLQTLENENDISGLTVILLDIDNFKYINDSFGHGVGDEVLKEFAGVLKKVFVADFVIRYGGDEFLVITRLDKKDSICAKMDSLVMEAENIVYGDGKQSGIRVSCGISVGATAGRHALEDLVGMSDEAMYYVKKHGKNGYCFYDEKVGENKYGKGN